jgi:hypothetical protein
VLRRAAFRASGASGGNAIRTRETFSLRSGAQLQLACCRSRSDAEDPRLDGRPGLFRRRHSHLDHGSSGAVHEGDSWLAARTEVDATWISGCASGVDSLRRRRRSQQPRRRPYPPKKRDRGCPLEMRYQKSDALHDRGAVWSEVQQLNMRYSEFASSFSSCTASLTKVFSPPPTRYRLARKSQSARRSGDLEPQRGPS